MEWDKDGELLAVLQEGSSIIKLWVRCCSPKCPVPAGQLAQRPAVRAGLVLRLSRDGVFRPHQDANQNQGTDLDTSMTNLTLISWSVTGPQLAIGNAKGDLVIYNKQQLKKQLIRGKHTKKITCGAWNTENKLALGSEDRQVASLPRAQISATRSAAATPGQRAAPRAAGLKKPAHRPQITISNPDGDTLHQNTLKQIPGDVQFARGKGEAAPGETKDTTMSVVLGGRSLLLYDVSALDRTPVELAFQQKYGNLLTYRWFGDGYIALGFESGYLVVMSSHQQEISEELFSQRLHSGRLAALALMV